MTERDIEDFLGALQRSADLRERVRSVLLADDFLALPGLVRANTEAIAALTARLETFIAATDMRFERLEQRMDRVEKRLNDIDNKLGNIDGRLGNVEGGMFELKYVSRAPGRWGRRYASARVIRLGEEADLHAAHEAGRISDSEWDDVILTDCVIRGVSKDKRVETIVAIELSTTVDVTDVERANRRAAILRRIWPNVVGAVDGERILDAARQKAELLGVVAIVQREAPAPPAA